jgi:hypothetical protein
LIINLRFFSKRSLASNTWQYLKTSVYINEISQCLQIEYNFTSPLLGPATITEKGVEQGQVIGVSFTEGNDCDEAGVVEESVVGLESHNEYLNHHGREHTTLPRPATITEKGVEQGQVISS